jgi:hypothetical protein
MKSDHIHFADNPGHYILGHIYIEPIENDFNQLTDEYYCQCLTKKKYTTVTENVLYPGVPIGSSKKDQIGCFEEDLVPFKSSRGSYVTVYSFKEVDVRKIKPHELFRMKKLPKCNLFKRQGLRQTFKQKITAKEDIINRTVWKVIRMAKTGNIEDVIVYIEYVDPSWKLSKEEKGWIRAFELYYCQYNSNNFVPQYSSVKFRDLISVRFIRTRAKLEYCRERDIARRWKMYKEKQMKQISAYLNKVHDYNRKDVRKGIKDYVDGEKFMIPEIDIKLTIETRYDNIVISKSHKKKTFSSNYGL